MTHDADSIFYRPSVYDGSNFQVNLNGDLTALRLNPNVDTGVIVLDSAYNETGEIYCKNGLAPSQHEHLFSRMAPNGSASMIGKAAGTWNLLEVARVQLLMYRGYRNWMPITT